jgi:5-formyltetrahydrofolate cyclo-ligase
LVDPVARLSPYRVTRNGTKKKLHHMDLDQTPSGTDERIAKGELRRRLTGLDLSVPDAVAAAHRTQLETCLDLVSGGGLIVAYQALPSEVDLAPLAAQRADLAARLVLPRTPATGHRLSLHPWSAPREPHRHGYDQPVASAPEVDDGEVGVVLAPGLAFDRRGVRLGRGGGYYDRLLARLGPEMLVIGVTADRIVDLDLPRQAHDVPMDRLATSTGVYPVPLGSVVSAVPRPGWPAQPPRNRPDR